MNKTTRQTKWDRKKAKRGRDHNHGKNGWVSGNPRYDRASATRGKNRSMGSN